MRYGLVFVFVAIVCATSPVSAGALHCNSAVQNWQNGSRTTCPYDSNGGPLVVVVQLSPPPVEEPPPPPPVQDDVPR